MGDMSTVIYFEQIPHTVHGPQLLMLMSAPNVSMVENIP